MTSNELSDALDELYSAPLREFIVTRKELAAKLRSKGLKSEAIAMGKASKPTGPAWVLNQLSRKYRKQVEWLIESNQNVASTLVSKKAASGYQEASRARQEILKQLNESTRRLLEDACLAPTATTLKKVSEALLALGTDEGSTEQLLRGRLTAEIVPSLSEFDLDGQMADAREIEIEVRRRKEEKLVQDLERAEEKVRILEVQAEEARIRAERAAQAVIEAKLAAIEARESLHQVEKPD